MLLLLKGCLYRQELHAGHLAAALRAAGIYDPVAEYLIAAAYADDELSSYIELLDSRLQTVLTHPEQICYRILRAGQYHAVRITQLALR